MDKAPSDLVEWYKLETEFFQDVVRHTRYVEGPKNRNEKVKEEWRNCGELGRGGFGVVNKQIRETTGHCRAVKAIDKRVSHKIDYSRELLVMSILAKCPSLFVEFLGWFEGNETLYIAMEYLPEGDLTKHIGTPLRQETVQNISKQILEGLKVMHQHGIAHRDLKPANIFVVRMSPVWVKIGDFGISKRILAHDTTTLHTQILTQVYGAPEVLGLDSNSETSDYTNSVDIWSLGCVIYELLVGARLFVSEGQVSRYYFGKFPFPEDKLKALSPPTDDSGVSFLESMLVIQPEDRPTAADALRHEWLVGVTCHSEDDGDDQDETTHGQDERTRSDKSENKIATHAKWGERGSERNLISQHGTKCTREDVALGAIPRPQGGSDPNTPKCAIGTSVITPPDTVYVESSLETSPLHSESTSGNFQGTSSKGAKDPRPPRSNPPSPDLLGRNNLQSAPRTNGPIERTTEHKSPAPIHDKATARITRYQTSPTQQNRFGPDDSETSEEEVSQNTTPNTLQRGDSRSHDPAANTKQTPTPGETLSQDGTLIPDTILMLARTLSRILTLAGILMLVGILRGTLALLETPAPDGTSDGGKDIPET
ncbi:kinase-like domain-containing protein [Tuber indicum]|nr:kinase-like domain-containing protein [Tuber indicum]